MRNDTSIQASRLGPLDVAAAQYLHYPAGAEGSRVTNCGYDGITELFNSHDSAAGEPLGGTGTDELIYTDGGRDIFYTARSDDTVVVTGQRRR